MKNSTDLLLSILTGDKKAGLIKWEGKSVPFIPELFAMADDISGGIVAELKPLINNPASLMSTSLGWCAYAGIGAAAMWQHDWDNLKKKGVLPALTEERGIGEMDEFVLDYVGIGFSSEMGVDLTERIHIASFKMMDEVRKAGSNNPKDATAQFGECLSAMYKYGIVTQMNRMGMH